MLHWLEFAGQLGDERDTLEIGHKNSLSLFVVGGLKRQGEKSAAPSTLHCVSEGADLISGIF